MLLLYKLYIKKSKFIISFCGKITIHKRFTGGTGGKGREVMKRTGAAAGSTLGSPAASQVAPNPLDKDPKDLTDPLEQRQKAPSALEAFKTRKEAPHEFPPRIMDPLESMTEQINKIKPNEDKSKEGVFHKISFNIKKRLNEIFKRENTIQTLQESRAPLGQISHNVDKNTSKNDTPEPGASFDEIVIDFVSQQKIRDAATKLWGQSDLAVEYTKSLSLANKQESVVMISDPFSDTNEQSKNFTLLETANDTNAQSHVKFLQKQQETEQKIKNICNPIMENIEEYKKDPLKLIQSEIFKPFALYIKENRRFSVPYTLEEQEINKVLDIYIEKYITAVPEEIEGKPIKELKRYHTFDDYKTGISKAEANYKYLQDFPQMPLEKLKELGEKSGLLRYDKTNLEQTLEHQAVQLFYEIIKKNPEEYGVKLTGMFVETEKIYNIIKAGEFSVVIDTNIYPTSVLRHSAALHKSLVIRYPISESQSIPLKILIFTSAHDEDTDFLSQTQETNKDLEQQKKEQRVRVNLSFILLGEEEYNKLIEDEETTKYLKGFDKEGQNMQAVLSKIFEKREKNWSNNQIQESFVITHQVLYKVLCEMHKDKINQLNENYAAMQEKYDKLSEKKKKEYLDSLNKEKKREQDDQREHKRNAALSKQDQLILKLYGIVTKEQKAQQKILEETRVKQQLRKPKELV